LIPALLTYFLSLLEEAKEKEKDLKRVLWTFQNLLKDIPEWNTDKVMRETETIQSNTKCDYLEELLTAVFVAHTKVLSAIRINSKSKKLQITIPKVDHFLHRTLSECARSLWSNAYLFSEQATSVDRQKNLRQVEHLLHQAILQSIRGMLPVKNILKEYLTDDGDVEGEKDEKDEEVKEEVKEDVNQEVKETITVPDIEVTTVTKIPTVEDLSGSVLQIEEREKETEKEKEQEKPPVIFVDTEQSVKFTDHDAMFDSDNPGQNSIDMKEHMEESDLASVSAIDILDPLAGGMDDFEDLEKPADQPMGLGDFETLA
jgi:glutaredoxin